MVSLTEDAGLHREKAAVSTDRMRTEVELLRGEAEQAVQLARTQRLSRERRGKE
ncbi:hypothetical protein ACF1B0_35425 [Streptomyces anandii]|uniref:hypothetical protein n=1 Tax=Streptomyces anandii TaxID=285454 RepID=UPI0036F7151B